ncbi:MAG: hypothetical protein OXG57_06445 [Acidimicrobiaceae bacterium]|nr:hypothetical protein [Acidimicrobiaceae bacterium]MCY3608068.1 hypothetical protein [Acidimicrobiaceae bacterium]
MGRVSVARLHADVDDGVERRVVAERHCEAARVCGVYEAERHQVGDVAVIVGLNEPCLEVGAGPGGWQRRVDEQDALTSVVRDVVSAI